MPAPCVLGFPRARGPSPTSCSAFGLHGMAISTWMPWEGTLERRAPAAGCASTDLELGPQSKNGIWMPGEVRRANMFRSAFAPIRRSSWIGPPSRDTGA